MKRLLSLLLATLMLAACANNAPSEDNATEPAEASLPTEIAEAAGTTEDTETTEATEVVEPGTALEEDGDEIYTLDWNYSHHTDVYEARYNTALVDLTLLQEGKPLFAATEVPASWTQEFNGIKRNENDNFDFRSMNISEVSFGRHDWNDFSFDSRTVWPEALPEGFDPETILEYSKNPGLGIRDLHDRGITGQGVGIAIIDQALLLDHEEYADNLMLYERIHCNNENAMMHGSAVSSLAVGKTIGTAPDSKLYYIASSFRHYGTTDLLDCNIIADCILRILEINENLPESEKIRVISISQGYVSQRNGYKRLQEIVKEANDQGVFVITASVDAHYRAFTFMGMEREYMSDPDDPESWSPARWLPDFYSNLNHSYQNYLWVPMGGRTYADCYGTDTYAIDTGGLSWAIPWLAGFYAMCCQVDPDITPEQFFQLAKDTATRVEIEHRGELYPMEKVINPAAVIEALENL